MRYTELTKKELQREYTKLTRRYTDFVREPLELDMTAEDTFGKSESRRAACKAASACRSTWRCSPCRPPRTLTPPRPAP